MYGVSESNEIQQASSKRVREKIGGLYADLALEDVARKL